MFKVATTISLLLATVASEQLMTLKDLEERMGLVTEESDHPIVQASEEELEEDIIIDSPPTTLEMPYDHAFEVPGTGFQSDGLKLKASPFANATSVELTQERIVNIGEVIRRVSIDTVEHALALKQTSNFNYDGWDFISQSKFANNGQIDDFMPNQISFIASRHIDFGTKQFITDPPFSNLAKKLVCFNKSTKKFHETFGDYYVAGHEIGSDLRIEITANIKMGRMTNSTVSHLREAFGNYANMELESRNWNITIGDFMKKLENTTDVVSFKSNILT